MKHYTIDIKDQRAIRTSTDGFQPKFIVDSGETFLKLQCYLSGRYLLDPYVEVIASELAMRAGVPCVQQKLVSATYRNNEWLGVASPVFRDQFVSFARLCEMNRQDMRDCPEYNRLDIKGKYEFLVDRLSLYTNSPKEIWRKYILNMTVLDVCVGNCDRHFHNFGVFNCETPALLFDFGMGLFVTEEDSDSYEFVRERLYIEPWSEAPEDLIEQLGLEGYLRGIKWDDLVELCPSPHGVRYFKEVMSIVAP